MFAKQVLQISTKLRDGPAQANLGVRSDLRADRRDPRFAPLPARGDPFIVGLYITSAYWFTPSASFANPAVTVARSLSNTFAGIAPPSAPAFIVAQLAGAAAAAALCGWLFKEERTT